MNLPETAGTEGTGGHHRWTLALTIIGILVSLMAVIVAAVGNSVAQTANVNSMEAIRQTEELHERTLAHEYVSSIERHGGQVTVIDNDGKVVHYTTPDRYSLTTHVDLGALKNKNFSDVKTAVFGIHNLIGHIRSLDCTNCSVNRNDLVAIFALNTPFLCLRDVQFDLANPEFSFAGLRDEMSGTRLLDLSHSTLGDNINWLENIRFVREISEGKAKTVRVGPRQVESIEKFLRGADVKSSAEFDRALDSRVLLLEFLLSLTRGNDIYSGEKGEKYSIDRLVLTLEECKFKDKILSRFAEDLSKKKICGWTRFKALQLCSSLDADVDF